MALKFKLFSFKIGSLTPANKKVYLTTLEGDVVEVSLKGKKDPKSAPKVQVIFFLAKLFIKCLGRPTE